MTIYIDTDFKSHTSNPDGTFREIETSFFDGKCDYFIEGYRFVPDGETWTRSDGTVFQGEMISPWKDCDLLEAAQAQYELMMAETEAAYREGVNSLD